MKVSGRYNHYGEDLTKRTAFGKVICARPNRFRAVNYSQQIHYLDPDTKRYELIDNTLIKTDAGLTNKANGDMRVALLP